MAHSFRFLKWNYITTIGASLGLLLLYGIIYLIFHDLAARQTIKKAQANAVAQNKGAARLSEKATQSGTKASIKHANIQKGVAEKANAAVKKAKVSRWPQLARGLGQVGLGLAGGFIVGDVADYYNKKETDMEKDIIEDLQDKIRKDRETAGKVISYEI